MEIINTLLTIVSGLVLRLGLPIGATALVIFLLRKLDNRWKIEAADSLKKPISNEALKPCWEVNNCSAEKRKNCPAAQNPNTPCWQHFRNNQGVLKEKCLGCDVFSLAPVHISGD